MGEPTYNSVDARAIRGCVPVAVAALCWFGMYVPGAPYWLDAPELVAAAYTLGHVHPPGHPLMMVLVKGAEMLPLSQIAWRANLCGAMLGALACFGLGVLAAATIRSVKGGWAPDGPLSWAAVWATQALFATTGSMAIQSLSVEVYGANTALSLLAAALAIARPDDARVQATVGLLVGLGLANHHFLTVLALPALAVAVLCGTRRRKRALFVTAGFALAAMIGTYAYLWARGLAGAWPAWADTSRPDGLFFVVSARMFLQSVGGFTAARSSPTMNLLKAVGFFASQLTPGGVVMAAGGAYVAFRLLHRRVGLALALLFAGSLASKVMMGVLDPHNPDDHGYFLVALAVLCLWAVLLPWAVATVLWRQRKTLWKFLALAVLVAVVGLSAPTGATIAFERRVFDDTFRVLDEVLEDEPPGAASFGYFYPIFFLLQYGRLVEGARPDLALLHVSMYKKAMGGLFYAEHVEKTIPALSDVAAVFLATGEVRPQVLQTVARRRPVSVDLPADGLDAPVCVRGWTQLLCKDGSESCCPRSDLDWHLQRLWTFVKGWGDKLDFETRRVLIWHLWTMARELARQGRWHEAKGVLGLALQLNPLDKRLEELSRRVADSLDNGRGR